MYIDFIVGTRPEITKIVAILHELFYRNDVKVRLILTGQQTKLTLQALDDLNVRSYIDTLEESIITTDEIYNRNWQYNFSKVIERKWLYKKPNLVIVQGDTHSSYEGANQATVFSIPVLHLEAGIRHLGEEDFEPEEVNRRRISTLASYHLAPTKNEFDNLINEGVLQQNIRIVGDLSAGYLTFCDTLIKDPDNTINVEEDSAGPSVGLQVTKTPYVLMTFHRPSSLEYIIDLKEWIVSLIKAIPEIQFVICRRPDDRWDDFYCGLIDQPNLNVLLAPSPTQFQKLLRLSNCVITDSAGVQQEALLYEKQVIVPRGNVELYRNHKNMLIVTPPYTVHLDKCIDLCLSKVIWGQPHTKWRNQSRTIVNHILRYARK